MYGHRARVWNTAFSPDAKILASGGYDHTIILWDVASGQRIGQPLTLDSPVDSLAFSPDGKTLASGSWNATIILWDVMGRQQIGPALDAQIGDVSPLAFSPDGRVLAAAKNIAAGSFAEFTILLWDVTSRQPIGLPLKGHRNEVSSLVFSSDGKTLASGSHDGKIILWDMDPQSWMEISCKRAGRNLTRAEWDLYFPRETYRATCPQWLLEPAPAATHGPVSPG